MWSAQKGGHPNLANVRCSGMKNVRHAPLTNSRPTPMSIVPPSRSTALAWRRSHFVEFFTRPRPSASATNGRPSPTEYNNSNTAPQTMVRVAAAAVRIVASTGPIHGAQPNANAVPNRNAERGPGRTRSNRRRSRLRNGTRRTPSITKPITMIATPAKRVTTGTLRSRTDPTRANENAQSGEHGRETGHEEQ